MAFFLRNHRHSYSYTYALRRFVSSSTIEQPYSRNGHLLNDLLKALDAEAETNMTDKSILLSKADAFNSRGVRGRLELMALLQKEMNIEKHHRIVDIGCGIGGTARYLNKNFGCSVVGVDLTEEYVNVGNFLIQMLPACHKDNRVQLLRASALKLPCSTSSMDIAWTEHVQMNIEHKRKFYSEISRVLVNGGRFAFHDVLLTEGGQQQKEPLRYPCPWANTGECSFLATETNLQSQINEAGLRITQWIDTTAKTIEFLERAKKNIVKNCSSKKTPSIGVHLLMGPNASLKVQNHLENMVSGKSKIIMGIAVKD